MRGGGDERGGDEGGGDEGGGGDDGGGDEGGGDEGGGDEGGGGNSGYSNRHDVQGITVIHKHERISTTGMIHVHVVQQAGVTHDAPHRSQLHMDMYPNRNGADQVLGEGRGGERGGWGSTVDRKIRFVNTEQRQQC